MKKYHKILLQVLFLVGIIALAFYLAELSKETESIRNIVANFGYPGVFVIALISGFNLVIPIPAIAFIPLIIESGLRFWPALFFIVIGMTIADMAAYYLGRIGHNITSISADNKILVKLGRLRERYKYAPMLLLLLFAAFAPLPNEIILIPFGFMGYKLLQVFPIILIGNLIFNIIYSSALISIFEMF